LKNNGRKNPYKDSGVDVAAGDRLVDWLRDSESGASTKNPLGELVGGLGGFSGLFRPRFEGIRDPLLVAGTDGVGTKLLLALQEDNLEGVGIDLVAMCVNDLYCVGARPLFFVDYYATGILDPEQFKRVLGGIRRGLSLCGAGLLGGETAELPGLYSKGHFDLAGFVVGVVGSEDMLRTENVKVGDRLYALASSGFHSNGYSLLRKWVDEFEMDEKTRELLLAPTKIYSEVPGLLEKLGSGAVHALSNITGGGISGNLTRVVPKDMVCRIEKGRIPTPGWMMDFLWACGAGFDDVEGVFNLGAGMIAVVDSGRAEEFESEAAAADLGPVEIGEIIGGEGPSKVEYW